LAILFLVRNCSKAIFFWLNQHLYGQSSPGGISHFKLQGTFSLFSPL
jgi:hypothetical protein